MKSNQPKPESASPPPETTGASSEASRRPYKAPRLRRLGSVRDLTLGSMGAFADGGGTQKSVKAM